MSLTLGVTTALTHKAIKRALILRSVLAVAWAQFLGAYSRPLSQLITNNTSDCCLGHISRTRLGRGPAEEGPEQGVKRRLIFDSALLGIIAQAFEHILVEHGRNSDFNILRGEFVVRKLEAAELNIFLRLIDTHPMPRAELPYAQLRICESGSVRFG